jgi:uncharacterized protein (DUF362 family)
MKRGGSRVSLVKGGNRKNNIKKALEYFKKDILTNARGKKILIKPNFVSDKRQLAASNVKAAEAVIEFFQKLGFKDIVVAEGSAGNTMKAFKNFGYLHIPKKYNVPLIDLNKDKSHDINVGTIVPVSRMMLDKDNFIISLAIPKTHDCVIATLSLKNILMGCITRGILLNKKGRMHRAKEGINKAMARLANFVYPDLAVIDGFESMEGNGPAAGTRVRSRFAIASLDALAADRVCLECMSIPAHYPAYLNYIYKKGLGEYDLGKIGVLGNKISDCQRKFKLHKKFMLQLYYR